MLHHVYPAWHKPVQRVLFLIGAILCITLPVLYGRRRIVSAKTLGTVLGLYFGLWLLFSVIARFCVPSPKIESTLPTYTHVPIPTPVVLHSPTRADALPTSPAIRLHPSSALQPSSRPPQEQDQLAPPKKKGPRFADSEDHPEEADDRPSPQAHNSAVVTFQTRPRGNTGDSTTSESGYPTFAAYRQAQHGNFDAFAQRIKRAFAISQQQKQEQEQRDLELLQQQQEQEQQRTELEKQEGPGGRPRLNSRQSSADGIHLQMLSAQNSTVLNTKNSGSGTKNRSRSASAASMIGDLAERIKNGTLFTRSQSFSRTASGVDIGGSGAGTAGTGATEIEIVVSPAAEDGPDGNLFSVLGARAQGEQEEGEEQRRRSLGQVEGETLVQNPDPATSSSISTLNSISTPDTAQRPGYQRSSSTRGSSPLANRTNVISASQNDGEIE